jgi:hypothetical protein
LDRVGVRFEFRQIGGAALQDLLIVKRRKPLRDGLEFFRNRGFIFVRRS